MLAKWFFIFTLFVFSSANGRAGEINYTDFVLICGGSDYLHTLAANTPTQDIQSLAKTEKFVLDSVREKKYSLFKMVFSPDKINFSDILQGLVNVTDQSELASVVRENYYARIANIRSAGFSLVREMEEPTLKEQLLAIMVRFELKLIHSPFQLRTVQEEAIASLKQIYRDIPKDGSLLYQSENSLPISEAYHRSLFAQLKENHVLPESEKYTALPPPSATAKPVEIAPALRMVALSEKVWASLEGRGNLDTFAKQNHFIDYRRPTLPLARDWNGAMISNEALPADLQKGSHVIFQFNAIKSIWDETPLEKSIQMTAVSGEVVELLPKEGGFRLKLLDGSIGTFSLKTGDISIYLYYQPLLPIETRNVVPNEDGTKLIAPSGTFRDIAMRPLEFGEDSKYKTVLYYPTKTTKIEDASAVVALLPGMNATVSQAGSMFNGMQAITKIDKKIAQNASQNQVDSRLGKIYAETIENPASGNSSDLRSLDSLNAIVDYYYQYLKDLKARAPNKPLIVVGFCYSAGFLVEVNRRYPGLIDGMILTGLIIPDAKIGLDYSIAIETEKYADGTYTRNPAQQVRADRDYGEMDWTNDPQPMGNTPTIIFVGENDPFQSEAAFESFHTIEKNNSNVKVVIVPGGGHGVMGPVDDYPNSFPMVLDKTAHLISDLF